MYIARKTLRVADDTGAVMTISPGQEVVGFEAWPHASRMAHLNQKIVQQTSDKVVLDMHKPQDVADAEQAAFTASLHSQVPVQQQVLVQKVVPEAAPAAEAVQPVADVNNAFCALCDRTFKDANGLRIHRARSHRALVLRG